MKWYSRLLGVFLFVVFVLPSHAAVADDWSFAVSVLPSAALAAPSQPKIEVVCFSANNCTVQKVGSHRTTAAGGDGTCGTRGGRHRRQVPKTVVRGQLGGEAVYCAACHSVPYRNDF